MTPAPVKIGAGLMYERLRGQNVITVEAVEAALDDVFRLWGARGMFGCQHGSNAEFAAHMLTALRDCSEVVGP